MEPLEITDQYGDLLLITTRLLDFVQFVVKGKDTHPDALCVEIKKDQAIQIINHLKQCFEL